MNLVHTFDQSNKTWELAVECRFSIRSRTCLMHDSCNAISASIGFPNGFSVCTKTNSPSGCSVRSKYQLGGAVVSPGGSLSAWANVAVAGSSKIATTKICSGNFINIDAERDSRVLCHNELFEASLFEASLLKFPVTPEHIRDLVHAKTTYSNRARRSRNTRLSFPKS